VGVTKPAKGSKLMLVTEGQGLPIGGMVASAQPAEIRLAEATLRTVRVPPRTRPQALVERCLSAILAASRHSPLPARADAINRPRPQAGPFALPLPLDNRTDFQLAGAFSSPRGPL